MTVQDVLIVDDEALARSSVARHSFRSASRTASCAGVASPSASASTHRSNCQEGTAAEAAAVVV